MLRTATLAAAVLLASALGAAFAILAFRPAGVPNASAAGPFVVNSTADTHDAAPGNGTCNDGTGNCTLRAAIEETNSLPGADTITFNPALSGATITFTITTNVDINGDLSITGPSGGITLSSTNAIVLSMTVVTVQITGLTVANSFTGISAGGTTLTLTKSTVSGNSLNSPLAGGIINNGGTVTLVNSTVSGNNARGNPAAGGILNVSGGTLTLINSTVTNNSSVLAGGITAGGIVNQGSGSVVVLENSIVAGNTGGAAADCNSTGTITSLGYNIDNSNTCGLIAASDQPNTNPLLGSLALNAPGSTKTHALQIGSPAIDKIPSGTNGCGTTITTDQRGVVRPQGAMCDIGAYEVAVNPDTDGDGCADAKEQGPSHLLGGERDFNDGSDFFDVPQPALLPSSTTGMRNKIITLSDVLSDLAYVGTSAANPSAANANGAKYGSDLNGNGIPDGVEYDRTPSTTPGQPWRSGPPNGTVTLGDVLTVLAQVGTNCS